MSEVESAVESTCVTCYSVQDCYGGPEEGGWTYPWYTFVRSMNYASVEEARAAGEVARKAIDPVNRGRTKEQHRRDAQLPNVETAFHDDGYIPSGWQCGSYLMIVYELPEEVGKYARNQSWPVYE